LKNIAAIPVRLNFTGILFLLAIVKLLDVCFTEVISSYHNGLPTPAQTEHLQEENLSPVDDLYELSHQLNRAFITTAMYFGPYLLCESSIYSLQKFWKPKVCSGFTAPTYTKTLKSNIPHLNLDSEDLLGFS